MVVMPTVLLSQDGLVQDLLLSIVILSAEMESGQQTRLVITSSRTLDVMLDACLSILNGLVLELLELIRLALLDAEMES